MAIVLVGMADLNVARAPDVLTTLGLGSCVGIALFDQTTRIGGLAHIMLPFSGGSVEPAGRPKFADTAIVDLILKMGQTGASRAGLVAKLAGGAHMFGGSNSNVLKVGERNIACCLEVLSRLRIPVLSNDTGGTYGRTIELYTESGQLKIKTIGHGEKFV